MALAASVIAGIGGARGDTVLKDAMKEAAPALLAGRTQARLIAQARGGLCRIIVGLGHANQRGLIDVLELIDVFVRLRGAAIDRRSFIITGTGLFVADTFAEIERGRRMSKRGRIEALLGLFAQVQARAGLEVRPALSLHTLFAGGRRAHAAHGVTLGEHAASQCSVAQGALRGNARRCNDAGLDCFRTLALLCAHHRFLNEIGVFDDGHVSGVRTGSRLYDALVGDRVADAHTKIGAFTTTTVIAAVFARAIGDAVGIGFTQTRVRIARRIRALVWAVPPTTVWSTSFARTVGDAIGVYLALARVDIARQIRARVRAFATVLVGAALYSRTIGNTRFALSQYFIAGFAQWALAAVAIASVRATIFVLTLRLACSALSCFGITGLPYVAGAAGAAALVGAAHFSRAVWSACIAYTGF